MVESVSMESIELYPREFFHYRLKLHMGGDGFRAYIGNISETQVLAIVPMDRYEALAVKEAIRGGVEARGSSEFFFTGRVTEKHIMEHRGVEVHLVRVQFDERVMIPVDLLAVIMAIGE